MAGSVLATPSGETGSVEPVELSFDALFRRMVAAMCGGWLCGLVVAGVLGRLVMRILASESSPAVQGLLTDDQARVGEISLGGSIALALTGAFGGSIAGLVYLLALRILPASALLRSVIFAVFAAAVGGALFVHSYDSFDYSRLDPVWFGVASFIGLPALFGLVVPTVIDTLAGPDGWFVTSAPMVLVVIAAIVFSGPVVFLTAPAIGLAFIVQRTESLRRLWASRFTTIVGVGLFLTVIVLGTLDLAVDISSIRAEEPRSCAICLDD